MDFVGNLSLFAAAKKFENLSRIDKVEAMVRMAQFFLTHSVVWSTAPKARTKTEQQSRNRKRPY